MRSHKKQVLCVEDEGGTIAAVVEELRGMGVYVEVCSDLAHAQERVEIEDYSLVLLDLRLPRSGEFREQGGVEFAISLGAGEFSSRNSATPCAIVTAFVHAVDKELLRNAANCRVVISKAAPVLRDLAVRFSEECPWLVESIDVPRSDYTMRDLLEFPGAPDQAGMVVALVRSWRNGDHILVKMGTLPEEVQVEIGYGDFPVYAWATVNVLASEAEYVRPHDFELELTDEAEEVFEA